MDAPVQLGQGGAGRIVKVSPMKLKALAVVALLMSPLPTAAAQTTDARGAAANKIYDWCQRLPSGTVSECSCVAGFYAGVTEDDEFQLIAVIVDYITADGGISDTTAMQAAVNAHQTAVGMTDDRLQELATRFTNFASIGAKADSICVPIKDHVTQ